MLNLWSGAPLLAIFLLLGSAVAIDVDKEADQSWNADYLSMVGGGFYGSESYANSGSNDSEIQYSSYREFFSLGDETPPEEGPQVFEISGNEPAYVYLNGRAVSYNDYVLYPLPGETNSLWIEGESSWIRYAACPLGSWLRLIAIAEGAGSANFYEIGPDGRVRVEQRWIWPYSLMIFRAEELGRYFLYFVTDNRPSNLIIVDVKSAFTHGTTMSAPTPTPEPLPEPSPLSKAPTPTNMGTSGDVSVTVKSEGMRGYDVYVDDVYVGKDGMNGDVLDGIYNLKLVGGQWHTVKVYDGEWFYGKPKYYAEGSKHTLYVEPATTVYIYGGGS